MSPIAQLQSDRMGFVEAGRIRLGEMVERQGKKPYPRELPHFALRDAKDLLPHYGTEPTKLLVYLPYPDRDENFRVYMEEFRSGGLYCQGDGERITRLVDPGNSGEVVIRGGATIIEHEDRSIDGDPIERAIGETALCPGPDRNMYPRCQNCRPRAMLFVMVRDPQNPMELIDRRLTYYVLTTGSMNNIREITESLNTIAHIADLMGQGDKGMTGIPCILRRVPGTVSVKADNGKRIQTEKWFVRLEYDRAFHNVASKALAAQARGALGIDDPAMLPGPEVTEDDLPWDEDDVTDAEWQEVATAISDELQNKLADIEAMRDDVPRALRTAQGAISELLGSSYKEREFFIAVRRSLGLADTERIKYTAEVWFAMLDVAAEMLEGGVQLDMFEEQPA